ncbi:hypothetical protein EDD22DRAFT_874777 [Suillus occidentalis]|nr:hypothetical protein EDD22DRAFT_874777 [Suillus occidentalis]
MNSWCGFGHRREYWSYIIRTLCCFRSTPRSLLLTSAESKNMGGGARYPYPKHVWSPAGGWWARPANWRSNTVITFAGIFAIAYGVWNVSADREVRHVQPNRPIPSMMWAKQYKDQSQES